MTLPLIILIVISQQVTVCRFTIDHFGIDMIDQVATGQLTVNSPFNASTSLSPATAVTAWSAGINTGQEWVNSKAHYKVAQLLGHPYILN